MKNAFVIAGIFALTTALGSTAASAQSNSGGGMAFSGAASGSASAQADAAIAGRSFASADYVYVDGRRSVARADVVAARRTARIHGRQQQRLLPSGTSE